MTDGASVRLGDVADFLTGFPFKSTDYTEDFSGVRLLRGDNIVQGALRWEGVKRWPANLAIQHDLYRLLPGDVVLAMDRPWIEAGLKYAALTEDDCPSLLVQRVTRLRETRRITARYLRYIIGGKRFTEYVLAVQTGTAVPHISGGQIKAFEFFLPSIPTQESIASVLGALDDKIELNRRMNETLEAMARAIFKDWFVDFGPTRAKMEGRAPYLAPDIWSLFPDRLDEEGKPEGWRYWPLQQIIDFKSGQNWLSQYRVESSQIPTFGANGRIGFSSNFIDEGRVIFVGKIGSCGSINEYNGKFWATNNTYYVKQPSTKYIEHARCLLRSIDWVPFIGGSSNPYMPLKNFDHLQCLMAADAIHEAFETIVGALRSFIEHCEQENASLAATRDFLLPKLMSGEVRVKDAEKLVGEAI